MYCYTEKLTHSVVITVMGITHVDITDVGVNRNRWNRVVYACPTTPTGWQKTRRLNVNVWRPEFDDCVLKNGGSSEAVLSWEGSNNVALHFSCSTTSLVLLVFGTQSSNSELHTSRVGAEFGVHLDLLPIVYTDYRARLNLALYILCCLWCWWLTWRRW